MPSSDVMGCLDDLQQFIDTVTNGDEIGPDEIETAQTALESLTSALRNVSVGICADLLPNGVSPEEIALAVVIEL